MPKCCKNINLRLLCFNDFVWFFSFALNGIFFLLVAAAMLHVWTTLGILKWTCYSTSICMTMWRCCILKSITNPHLINSSVCVWWSEHDSKRFPNHYSWPTKRTWGVNYRRSNTGTLLNFLSMSKFFFFCKLKAHHFCSHQIQL